MAVAEYVCQLLDAKAGFETVSVKEEATKLRLLGRVPAAAQLSWKAVRLALLLAGETEKDRPWSCDVSRQYFLVDGVERYAWRLIIQSAGTPLDVLLPELIELFGRVNVPASPKKRCPCTARARSGRRSKRVRVLRGCSRRWSAVMRQR
jgi:hypothetical protein